MITTTYHDPTDPRWNPPRIVSTTGKEFTSISIGSTVEVLKLEIEMLEKEIDRLRKAQHKGVVIEAVKALRCPCCNAPIQFGNKPYIMEIKEVRRRCEYCGCLLEFLTKE